MTHVIAVGAAVSFEKFERTPRNGVVEAADSFR